MSEPIRYLPVSVVQDIRMELQRRATQDVDVDDPMGAWGIERLCERAFSEGYAEAYVRGHQAGWDAARVRYRIEQDNAAKTDGAVSE